MSPGLQLQWFGRAGSGSRVPLVLQTEAAECGLACLAMVAGAFGFETDLRALRKRFSVSLKGATMADLVRMAEGLGLVARGVRAELGELGQLSLPAVLHWDMNHFVVLAQVRRDEVLIHDPAGGARWQRLAEISPHFTGVALELQPGMDFKARRERQPVRLAQLVGPVQGWKRSLGQILVLALALEAFVLLTPFLMQWVVDGVLVSADRDLLLTLALGFGLLVLVQSATAAARGWAVLVLSATLNHQWLASLFAHLLRLPAAWFEKRHLGDVWSRFGSVQTIQKTLTTSFVEAVLDGTLVLLTLGMMLLYSPRLAAVALLAVLVYGLLRAALVRRLTQASERSLVHEARQNSHFVESLRGVVAIKLQGAMGERASRFGNLVVETMNAQLSVRKLELGFAVAQRLLFGLERVAVIALGALLVLDGHLSVGMLFAFFAWKETFSTRVAELVDKLVELRMLRLQGERLADIALAEPEAEVAGAGAGLPARGQPLALELRGLRFAYADGEPEVLRGIDLRIEPGESVAIVGPSGCGKSTLVKLLLGLHQPTGGEIIAGGVPLSRLGPQAWRERVGAVMQDEPLFSGTVLDNICFFDPDPELAWAEECARMAAVHDEVQAMPMQYRTLIGDMGAALSGGQKQRILLARALYRRPGLLLLDEATSSLDVERERAVNAAVRQLGMTRVIVAHRPETIASASRVIVLHEGRVA